MNIYAEKTSGKSVPAAAASSKQPVGRNDAIQDDDHSHRSQINAPMQLQAAADNSPQVRQLKSYQQMADSRPRIDLKHASAQEVAQRVLIVGSHNEKYDIEDMGLWWTMACEHMNSAKEGLEPVILTLKDFDRDYDQEFTISVTDKIRFITHGNPSGETVANETPKGEGEGEWGEAGMDLKTENWSDIEKKILTQIEVFNLQERERIDTGSLLKPYFCFMKENEGLMKRYQGDLGDIGVGATFLTNRYVLALDSSKMDSNAEILGKAIADDDELIELFTEGAGWRSFDELKGKLPLLNRYKTEKEAATVNLGDMYEEIYNFIEPRYQKLVEVVEAFITGNASRKAPWDNLRERVKSTMDGDERVE